LQVATKDARKDGRKDGRKEGRKEGRKYLGPHISVITIWWKEGGGRKNGSGTEGRKEGWECDRRTEASRNFDGIGRKFDGRTEYDGRTGGKSRGKRRKVGRKEGPHEGRKEGLYEGRTAHM
jgi:hypothetical protein